jgi:hypothetical protein
MNIIYIIKQYQEDSNGDIQYWGEPIECFYNVDKANLEAKKLNEEYGDEECHYYTVEKMEITK